MGLVGYITSFYDCDDVNHQVLEIIMFILLYHIVEM